MGLSGAAFGFAFKWCPSARHCASTFYTTKALEKLGFSFKAYTKDENGLNEEILKHIIIESINNGNPIIIPAWYDGEAGMIVGYDKDGMLLANHPNKGHYEAVSETPKELIIIESYTPQEIHSASQLKHSLKLAVDILKKENWKEDYLAGFWAYSKWISDLKSKKAIEEVSKKFNTDNPDEAHNIVLWVHGYIIGGLDASRYSTAKFLRNYASISKNAEKSLLSAADKYEKASKLIRTAEDIEDKSNWQIYLLAQANALEKALELEKAAMNDIEIALGKLK